MASLLNMSSSRLVGSKVLPYDAEIEYLGFWKGCTVDTGIMPSTNYKYYWKYLWTGRDTYVYIFSNYGSRGNWFIFGGIEHNNMTQIHIKSSSAIDSGVINANTLYEGSLMHNGNKMELKLNDTLMLSLTYTDFQASSTLIIRNVKNFTINIYGFSIYNENNVLILDLIPVRVGTTGYMYDKVSKQLFANARTGNFILGPDKTN